MPKAKMKPSLAQVKAWLATVLGPMVSALEQETVQLKQKDWSFRFYSQDFEFLWSTDQMIALPYHPNLRQFWRYYPQLHRLAQAHDTALDNLRAACVSAYRSLLEDKAFTTFVHQVVPEDDSASKYFAEYVINGLQDLGARNVLRDKWTANRADLLRLQRAGVTAPNYQTVEQAGLKFARAAEILFRELDRHQQLLADEHGLPPVAPTNLAAS